MKTTFQLLWASFKQFLRDKSSLFFTFAFPIVFMVIFGLIWSGDNNFSADIGLAVEDNSPAAQAVSQAFNGIPAFKVTTGSLEDLVARLKKGEIKAVVQVPENLGADLAGRQPVDLQLYYDPSNTTTTQVILPIVNQIVEQMDRQINRQPALLGVHEESIQSHQLRNIDYLVPGIIAMSIMTTGLFCAVPLIQQREKKILKRWSATPIRRSSLIYSQVIFRLVLAVAQTAILVFIANAIFGVQMLGNWVQLLGLVVLGALCLISIGYVIASLVRTEEGAMPVIQLVQFPMMFLSGIFFPLEMLPNFMKPLVNAMPLTYLGDALRQVMIQAVPSHTMLLNIIVMGGIMALCLLASIKLFRWE